MELSYEQKMAAARLISRTSKYKLPYVLHVLGIELPADDICALGPKYDLDKIYNLVESCEESFRDDRMIYIKNAVFYELMNRQRIDPRKVLKAMKDSSMIKTYEKENRYAVLKRRNGRRVHTIAMFVKEKAASVATADDNGGEI